MLNFLIAPDFPPDNFVGWHIFNTTLQRKIETDIHLLTPSDHAEQMDLINRGKAQLIYANPFDAAELVRSQGYLPVARPINKSDEMVIATYAEHSLQHSDDLQKNCSILVTENYDVRLIGLRLLESASLTENDINWLDAPTFQTAARRLLNKEADAAFFLASAYHDFNATTRSKLRVLMESRLNEFSHVVLLKPDSVYLHNAIQMAFINMKNEPSSRYILEDLGIPEGFSELTTEETEFMIDLMETLKD